MVITNLYIIGVSINKPETYAPLVIDGDRVLSLPVAFKCMKPVTWWDLQIIQACSQIQVFKFTHRTFGDFCWKPP